MSSSKSQTDSAKQKVYFIRVGEQEYKKITSLAEQEERSINQTANLLIKAALESKNS